MDYSNFRRSNNLYTGPMSEPADLDFMQRYIQFLQQKGIPVPAQDDGSYVPMQFGATPEQLTVPMAQSLGIQDISPLTKLLAGSLEPEKPKRIK